ncbi:MAG: Fe-S cluster assembly protein SufD [Deltaproteobacteria bacterium]|nr:Fe-S cluster assembly protein SufD [Deltaproteobacteria bacterium]
MKSSQSKERFLSAFERFQKGFAASPDWLRDLRRAGIACFDELGFPTTRDEEWRFTNVEPIVSTSFESANGAGKILRPEDLYSRSFIDSAYNRIVFVNGIFCPEHSSVRGLPSNVRVENLSAALTTDDGVIEPYLSRDTRYRQEAFVALNTAFTEEGAFVLVPRGVVVTEPIYLVFASYGNGFPVMSHPRNLVICEAGSQARIVESYVGFGEQPYLTNVVTKVVGEEGAIIDYYRVQREASKGYHVGALSARMSRNCSFTAHSVTLSGSLIRNDIHALLDGEGATCVLNGLYLLDGKQHVDNHTEIDHAKPRATSQELYKGILSGTSHAVFNGKILVQKDAQKSDARQTNKNLLLSENAVVNTKPQLEIHADDVKCSHGSTIGQLDTDALFYLRSRGLDAADAQSLLSYAFASDLVGRMRIAPLRARLDDYLLTSFRRSQS